MGSNQPSVAIRNSIRIDDIIDIYVISRFCVHYISKTIEVRNSKQKNWFPIFLMHTPYSFQSGYLSVALVNFIKVEVKLDRFFVNLTVKITCYMGRKVENKFNFICIIYFSTRKKKQNMYKIDEANEF